MPGRARHLNAHISIGLQASGPAEALPALALRASGWALTDCEWPIIRDPAVTLSCP